jgi:hypothetical protein
MNIHKSTVGGGSSVGSATVGRSSSVGAGPFPPSGPQIAPAAHVRAPDPAGSRSRTQRAGAERAA